MDNQFIAHLRKRDQEIQSLWDHLEETSEFCGKFAKKIGLRETGEVLGFFHDLGKASKEFQNYIQSATGLINPDEDEYVDATAKKGKVDHSSAGAQIIYRYLNSKGPEGKIAAQVFSLCIASHHSGLIDCLTPDGVDNFTRRMNKPEEGSHSDEAMANLETMDGQRLGELMSKGIEKQLVGKMSVIRENNDSKETITFKYGLLIRFLYSCLIDADRLSTANFEFPGNAALRNAGDYQPWETLIGRLDEKIKEFENKENKNDVDEIRTQVSQSCFAFSTKPQGIYQLTVPTGGGKTFASLRFALNHAAEHKLDRVFYVIPFTSIIDQNADEVRKILEDKDTEGNYLDKVVLEHHSNLTPEEETGRHNLLAENWDAPVVFTTQVQFLEALFGSGTRSARRMHQLANSVIIFDEVQTIPVRCVHMFNVALRFLVQSCGSTVVLCTATQPLLDKIDPVQRALTILPEQHIIPDEKELFNNLRRVDIFDRRKAGGWSDEEVSDLAEQELSNKGSVLIVVNTKNSARSLYRTIVNKNIASVYHLSTNMCPAHRLVVLKVVKDKLTKTEPVICVSTQLIEAGVDIDFGSVIRYLAGLDSIAQAAGRCNRNGKPEPGNVFIVNPVKENIEKLIDIRVGTNVAQRVLDEFNANPDTFDGDRIGLSAMGEYYQYYFYQRNEEMNYPVEKNSSVGRDDDLFNLLSMNTISVAEHQRINNSAPKIAFRQSFRTAAKAFKAIESSTRGVVVPYGEEGIMIVCDLCGALDLENEYKLLKKAQRFSVNLLPDEFKQMKNKFAIHEVQESGIFVLDDQYYSAEFGWCSDPVNDMKTLICQ